MDACPCCGKIFESFADYPAVHVVEFSRLPLHDLTFPYFHAPYLFEVPGEVTDEFSRNRKFSNRAKMLFTRKREPVAGIGHLGDFVESEGSVWVREGRTISCFNRDEKRLIFDQMGTYLKFLEDVVDSLVLPDALMPHFVRPNSELCFRVPGSGYYLAMGMRTLYSLGWMESKLFSMGEEEFSRKIKDADKNGKELYNIILEEVRKELDTENEGLPEGYKRVGLYIMGLRPTDTSSITCLMRGEKFSVKFAEFVFQGKTLEDI